MRFAHHDTSNYGLSQWIENKEWNLSTPFLAFMISANKKPTIKNLAFDNLSPVKSFFII